MTLFPVQYIDEYVQSFLQGASGSSSAVVPLQLDALGKVKYDALARMGQSKDKVRTVRMTAGHFISSVYHRHIDTVSVAALVSHLDPGHMLFC